MTDKPLHVQVAEALGAEVEGYVEDAYELEPEERWRIKDWDDQSLPAESRSIDPDDDISSYYYNFPPRYDTDWSATGPLIEKYRIEIQLDGSSQHWEALHATSPCEATGPTPLVAVCNLIIELGKAGKLR